MKKLLLIITIALAASIVQAQSYVRDSLFLEIKHPTGSPYFDFRQPHSIMTDDGKILTCLPTKTLMGFKVVDFGDWLYKIDPQNLAVIDSVFVETDYTVVEDITRPLLANAPNGGGYILAKLIHNKLSYPGFPGMTWLRISHIDEALNMQPHEDALKVLLEDSAIINNLIGITLEGNQIVLAYKKDALTPVIARIGLDGTIHEKKYLDDLFLLDGVAHGLAVYNDAPREYSLSDWTVCENDTCLVYHVLDSLFALKETIVMGSHVGDIYPVSPGLSASNPRPLDDGTFIQAIKYERHNINRNGACLLKFNKTTHECLADAQFESWPIYLDPDKMGYPIGIVKTVNDNIYFAYRTNNNISGGSATTRGWLGIAKLDKDLNIIWQRYCLGSYSVDGYLLNYCHVSQIDDGFVIVGKCNKDGESFNFFYYVVHDEDPYNSPEAEAYIRPYLFYPNPAQDQIHLQYSPDVKPAQVEFYDLQGRLVRTQSKELESINLQGLAPGQYLMKVTLEDGKTYSDKVVKE